MICVKTGPVDSRMNWLTMINYFFKGELLSENQLKVSWETEMSGGGGGGAGFGGDGGAAPETECTLTRQ